MSLSAAAAVLANLKGGPLATQTGQFLFGVPAKSPRAACAAQLLFGLSFQIFHLSSSVGLAKFLIKLKSSLFKSSDNSLKRVHPFIEYFLNRSSSLDISSDGLLNLLIQDQHISRQSWPFPFRKLEDLFLIRDH